MARRKRSPKPPSGDYEVGYRKLPVAARFQKGQSGNPKGRPRGARNAGTIVADILARKVTLREAHGERRVPYLEALLMRAADNAGKGDLKALQFLLDLHRGSLADAPEIGADEDLAPEDQAIIDAYLARRLTGDET